MQIKLKYGQGYKSLDISDKAEVNVLSPAMLPLLEDSVQALRQALKKPLGDFKFKEASRPNTVTICVPDESRPAIFKTILPVLLMELRLVFPHLRPDDVTILIAGGLHPPMDEKNAHRWAPPETHLGSKVSVHDAQNSELVDYGSTTRGTPVQINAELARADLKMAIGQIDPHQFVGFTGGSKAAIIGAGSEALIESNHRLMFRSGAEVGRLDGNPVREDLNEAGRMIGLDLVVNTVLDSEKQVVGLWAGRPDEVLKAGAEVCRQVYGVAVHEKYDLAVASCGGYPKDICLYQAQKGLNLASHAVKPGGKILLLASCDQGVGDDVYYDYVRRFKTFQEALTDFKKMGFKMGAHKSFLFGRTLADYEVVLNSELNQNTVNECHLKAGPAEETLNKWVDEFPGRPKLAVAPNANTTYFYTP